MRPDRSRGGADPGASPVSVHANTISLPCIAMRGYPLDRMPAIPVIVTGADLLPLVDPADAELRALIRELD